MADKGREADDLIVMSHDGDITIDGHVRQEMGLLVSDRHEWAMPLVQAAPIYSFRQLGAPPMKERAAFIYRRDPPPPGTVARIINSVLPEVTQMASRGAWRKRLPISQRLSQLRYIVAGIAVLGTIVIMYSKQAQDSALEAERLQQRGLTIERVLEANEDAPPQPTYDGLGQ